MKQLFLIIGAPGSGKTTDARIIAKNGGFVHFSTGELLRDEVASSSDLGKTIHSFINCGNLVPLEIVINVIIKAIVGAQENVVLIDGFPRSIEQMKKLSEVLATQNKIVLKSVIEIVVDEEVARHRALGRARGVDDKTDVFANRMKVYTDSLTDIQSFYKSKNLLYKISGERTIDEIVVDMKAFIDSKI